MTQTPRSDDQRFDQPQTNFSSASSFTGSTDTDSESFNGQNPYGDVTARAAITQDQSWNFSEPHSTLNSKLTSPKNPDAPKIKRKESSNLGKYILPLVIVIAAGSIIFFAVRPSQNADPVPSPSIYTPLTPTPSSGTPENQFSYDGNRGSFIIHDSTWKGNTLSVDVEIVLDEGELFYSFMALDETSGNIAYPDYPSEPDMLDSGTLEAGQSVRGIVKFEKTRETTKVALTDEYNQRNLTMITVPG